MHVPETLTFFRYRKPLTASATHLKLPCAPPFGIAPEMLSMMEPSALEFLRTILTTPSPSGYEARLQQIVRTYADTFADEVRSDMHGNVIAVRNPTAAFRVMLAGHCDQIGLIVQHVDDEGFLYVQPIGGWDVTVLVGQRLTVWSDNGPVTGVIARKAIHLLNEEERKQVPKIKDLWLDIGARDKEDALKMVRIGDAATVALHFEAIANGLAISLAMDDKTGLWVVLEALRRADGRETPLCRLRRFHRAGGDRPARR